MIDWIANNRDRVWKELSSTADGTDGQESLVAAAVAAAREEGLTAGLEELFGAAGDLAAENLNKTTDREDGPSSGTPVGGTGFPTRTSMFLPSAEGLISDAYRHQDFVRAQAILLYAAWQTENSEWLQAFRRSVLGEGTLSPQSLFSFLLSPALRLLPRVRFTIHGEDLRTHEVSEVDEGAIVVGERLRKRYTLRFAASGQAVPVDYDEEAVTSYAGAAASSEVGWHFGKYETATYYPGTVFDEIMKAGEYASGCLLGCSHRAALAFLLCGELPPVRLMQANWLHSMNVGGDPVPLTLADEPLRESPNYSASHVTLTVPLWMSADAVEDAFRRLQQAAIGNKENRPPKTRNLQLFCFVLSERRRFGIAGEGTEDERRAMYETWNGMCQRCDPQLPGSDPGWMVNDLAQFTRTCRRVEESIFPSFFFN